MITCVLMVMVLVIGLDLLSAWLGPASPGEVPDRR
jgi:hypothetical protein